MAEPGGLSSMGSHRSDTTEETWQQQNDTNLRYSPLKLSLSSLASNY